MFFRNRYLRNRLLAEKIERKLGRRMLVIDRSCHRGDDLPASEEEIDRWFSETLGKPCSKVFNVRKLWLAWLGQTRPRYVIRYPIEDVYLPPESWCVQPHTTPFERLIPGAHFVMTYYGMPGCTLLHEAQSEREWPDRYRWSERNPTLLFEQVGLIPEQRERISEWPQRRSERPASMMRGQDCYAVIRDVAMSLGGKHQGLDAMWFWTTSIDEAMDEAAVFNEAYGLAVCVAKRVAQISW